MKKMWFLLLLPLAGLIFTACNPIENKMRGGLQIISNNIAISVFLDGQYIGKSPYINKTLQPGEYILRLEPNDQDLVAYETPINLKKGLLTVVTWKPGNSPETSGGVIYELEPNNNKKITEVSFISIPDNTIIQFDNQEKQFSPLIISDLEPGHHEFEAHLPSYETQKHTINLVAGHRLNVYLKLAKAGSNTDEPSKPTPTDIADSEKAVDSSLASPSAVISREKFLSSIASPSGKTLTGIRIKILPTNFYINGKEVLRVRNEAGVNGKELGFAAVNSEYSYLNEESNNWYKIKFDNQIGWVSQQYSKLIKE